MIHYVEFASLFVLLNLAEDVNYYAEVELKSLQLSCSIMVGYCNIIVVINVAHIRCRYSMALVNSIHRV